MNLNHTGAQLELPMVEESHSGDYRCHLYNSVTSRFSSASAMIRIMGKVVCPVGGKSWIVVYLSALQLTDDQCRVWSAFQEAVE